MTVPAKWLKKLDDLKGPDDHSGRARARQRLQLDAALALRGRAREHVESAGTPSRGPAPTIAVVDSGIQAGRADFGNRVLAQVNLSTLPDNSAGDGRGHGTFVAGIAAGGADGYTGGTPQAKLVSLDVMDDHGVARTSDVIAACQWILANKDKYNIRIANFSLHSATASNFIARPAGQGRGEALVQQRFVVAAAGNYGNADGPSGVPFAPGNDPFVMTVGAIDIGGTKSRYDDTPRTVVGVGPHARRLREARGGRTWPVHGRPGSRQLVARGRAAGQGHRARLHPALGHVLLGPRGRRGGSSDPGQASEPHAGPGQGRADGVGQAGAQRAGRLRRRGRDPDEPAGIHGHPPNPNKALDKYLVNDVLAGGKTFNSISWYDAAKSSVSWDSVSWDSVSWADVSWNDVSWADVSWSDVSWADVSWADVSWADVSWNDTSYEDAAEGDTSGDPNGYELTPEQAAAVMADPDIAPPRTRSRQRSQAPSATRIRQAHRRTGRFPVPSGPGNR